MTLFILAHHFGGLFISILMSSVIIVFSIPPVFLKFGSEKPELPEARRRKILIIGDGTPGKSIAAEVAKQNSARISVAGFVTKSTSINEGISTNRKVLGTIDGLEDIIKACRINEVIIAEDNEDLDFIFDAVERSKKMGVKVRVFSKKLEIIEKKVKLKKYFDNSCIEMSKQPDDKMTTILKRAGDLIIASIALIILFPPMLVIASLVKATSPGNILFKQFRVGRNGKQFKMLKFRTMCSIGSEDERRKEMMLEFMKNNTSSGGDTKIIDESRVTKVGRLLRKTSLDELPQLINVLKGEMSLVGPRPCVPYEFENYEPWQKRRVCVLPGCTGVWQVSGRSSVSFRDSIILDLYYVHNVSVLLDLVLLLKTIPVLLFSKGGR